MLGCEIWAQEKSCVFCLKTSGKCLSNSFGSCILYIKQLLYRHIKIFCQTQAGINIRNYIIMLNIKDALAAHAECDRKVILTENKNHPYDLAEKKTDHLEDLYRITNMEVLITEDVVTFTANYKIGITDLQFILLCGENRDKHGKLIDDCLVPYSFRIEEIGNEKFGELYEVDFIFCKQTNESKYEIIGPMSRFSTS